MHYTGPLELWEDDTRGRHPVEARSSRLLGIWGDCSGAWGITAMASASPEWGLTQGALVSANIPSTDAQGGCGSPL